MKEERKKFRIIEGIILIIILIGIISQCDFQNKNENIVNNTTEKINVSKENNEIRENQPKNGPVIINDPYMKELPKNPFIIPGLKKIKIDSQLNENYSFDNFVEGALSLLAPDVQRREFDNHRP